MADNSFTIASLKKLLQRGVPGLKGLFRTKTFGAVLMAYFRAVSRRI
jgi:hypothetical protein